MAENRINKSVKPDQSSALEYPYIIYSNPHRQIFGERTPRFQYIETGFITASVMTEVEYKGMTSGVLLDPPEYASDGREITSGLSFILDENNIPRKDKKGLYLLMPTEVSPMEHING